MLNVQLGNLTAYFELSTIDKFSLVNLRSWYRRTPRERGVYTVITDCWHRYDKLEADVTVGQSSVQLYNFVGMYRMQACSQGG